MRKSFMTILALGLLLCGSALAEELAVGAAAPQFALTDAVTGKTVSFTPSDGKLKVVVFTCNQCPYARAFEGRIVSLGREYAKKGVVFYAIDSNDDQQYEIETAANMKERAVARDYPFPYLKDGDSKVAGLFGARVTPHVFVVDGRGTVVYRGYVDDSAKPAERTHAGLADALDAAAAGQPVKVTSTRAFGCTIKWKSRS